jgi:predicted phage tail protein
VGDNAYIDTVDVLGTLHTGTEVLLLTDNTIETLDLISEGVIEGPLSGQWMFSGNIGQTGWSSANFSGYIAPAGFENFRWLRSVYWNQLPVLNEIGTFNFQNVDLSYTVGLPNGDVLQQLTNEETTSRTIGTVLYAQNENLQASQIFRILNRNCRGVIVNIKMPSLSNTNSKNGDIERTLIQHQISYRPVFSSVNKISNFNTPTLINTFGKIVAAGGYINSTRIDFSLSSFTNQDNIRVLDTLGFFNDSDFIGWEIYIERLTPDSTSALLANSTYIDSITELYGNQFSYPNSSIVRQTFDAKFFSQIPNRAFECNFIKVKIPANYNPIMRTYSTTGYGTTNGYWNGTFASGKYWTNNPAWCFYDLITNNRYGLGKFVDNIDVYKFDLYNISQYCDELVADGYGGLEPRFTCNVWIPQKEEAYKVVNDMASIFRGMVYYFNGNLNAIQDSPKTNRYTFTNSNVENGDFNYNSSSKKTRQSIAVVRYNDPKNFYQPSIEYVEDLNSIRKYGIRELPITAFGCTSRGQAI